MKLTLCCSGSDSSPRVQIRHVLRRDGIKNFTGHGNTASSQVAEKVSRNLQNMCINIEQNAIFCAFLSGHAHLKTAVDLERSVNVGVVDQTLPADGCAGLCESKEELQVLGKDSPYLPLSTTVSTHSQSRPS